MSYLKELARNFQRSQEVQPPQESPSLTVPTGLTMSRPVHPGGMEKKLIGWSKMDKARIQREAKQRATGRNLPL